MRPLFAVAVALLALCFAAPAALAQLPQAGDTTSTPTAATGHDYLHSPVETVNPANGSVSIRIPVRNPQGRQLNLPFSFSYDSAGAFYIGEGPGNGAPNYYPTGNASSPVPYSEGGWSYSLPILTYQITIWTQQYSSGKNYTCTGSLNYMFQDPGGNRHSLGLTVSPTNGPGGADCGDGVNVSQAGEGSILATTSVPTWPFSHPPTTVTDGNGTIYSFPGGSQGATATSVTDRNGNSVSISGGAYTDTIGRSVLNVPGFGSSPDTITVGGLSSPYKVYWTTASASFTDNMVNLEPGILPNCPTAMSGSSKVASSVLLPNGRQFTFTYDPTYGMLAKIVYPSGGYVRYVWGLNLQAEEGQWSAYNGTTWSCSYDFPAITDRYVSFDGSTEVLHQHFAYTTNWQNNGAPWKTTTVTTTDLVRNTSFTTAYTYSQLPSPGVPDPNPNGPDWLTTGVPAENTIQYKDVGGTLLKTVTKSWYNRNIRLLGSEQTTLDNGKSSLTVYCYNTSEELTETDQYDLGTATATLPTCANGVPSGTVAGPLLRKTTKTYATFTAHIVDLPSTVITYDGSGNRVGETDSFYDQTGSANRGNLTTQTKDCFVLPGGAACSSGNPSTIYTYDSNGQPTSVKDPNGNTTTYSYADSYSGCGGNAPPNSPSDAYLTQATYPATNGVNHIVNYCYDYTAGLMLSSTDENSQTTTYKYVDSLDRLTETDYPDTGQMKYAFSDAGPTPTETTTRKMNSSQSVVSVSTMNGLGEVTQTQLTSDLQGTDITLKTLDGMGRDYKVYNPYRTTSDPTYGYTTYVYDALDRTTSVTKPDSSVVTTQYCGPETLVTDEAGHWRRSKTDGLNRLIEVDEPNSTTATVQVCPGTGEPIWATTYTYDILNDLLSVAQGGSRNRSFAYDSLKQLLQSTNPESGTICYGKVSGSTCQQNGYDANGNVIYKTDARSILTTNAYDVLNRVTSITYSDSTPAVGYTYDQSACLGQPTCYNIGHRTTMTDAGGTENLAYDKMGRELTEQRTTNAITKSTIYTYDLAGDLTTLTYPSGRMITYTYDSAGRPSEAQDVANSINYALGTCLNGLSSNGVCYGAFGSVEQMQNGTNLVSTYLYNTRLQPCWLYATTGSALTTSTLCTATDSTPGNILDLKYNFNVGSGDNGNVIGITNNRTSGRTQSFTYDQVNRILTAQTSSTTTNCWGETYTYDQWANMYAMTGLSGYGSGCNQDNLSVSPTTNNQLSATGYSYDASGSMLTDGANTYGYNAESEIKSAAGVNYTYDGDGNRLQKSSGKIYWYGAGTEILDESDLSGKFTNEYVFLGGKRIAMRNVSTGTTYYYEEDMLGSSRTMVQAGQTTPCFDADFLPFGKEVDVTATCTQNYKFEGKERDTETLNDDFGARYFSWRIGRWLSADWSSVPAPVPYANLSNPQTLNLYSMVSDNPESFADLNGHCMIDFDCVWHVWWFGAGQVHGGNDKTNASAGTSANNHADSGATEQSSQQTGVQQAQQSANDHTKPPPVPVPGHPDLKWEWHPDAKNSRGGTWGPTKGSWNGAEWGSPPSATIEAGKDGKPSHWDVDDGTGKRQRYNEGAKPITPEEAHASSSLTSRASDFVHAHPIVTGVAAGVVILGVAAAIVLSGGAAAAPILATAAAL